MTPEAEGGTGGMGGGDWAEQNQGVSKERREDINAHWGGRGGESPGELAPKEDGERGE